MSVAAATLDLSPTNRQPPRLVQLEEAVSKRESVPRTGNSNAAQPRQISLKFDQFSISFEAKRMGSLHGLLKIAR